jgi:four helix bundle protein
LPWFSPFSSFSSFRSFSSFLRHMARLLLHEAIVIGEELKARARQFAMDVIDLCLELGTDDLARLVRPQLLRACTGLAANYRAAGRSRSRREFVAKLGVVIEEADESELWLDVLETKKCGPSNAVSQLRAEARELRAIFVASRGTALAGAGVRKRRT